MVNRCFYFAARSGDFALEPGDARLQLGDRERVEILTRQLRQQVVGSPRKVVHVHNG